MLVLKKKRKSRKITHLIGTEETFITDKEALEIIDDLEKKIRKIMKQHIGYANAITPYNLFVKVFDIAPIEVDVYKRTYLWNLIKKMLRTMRSENTCFIYMKGNKIFVLQSQEELEYVLMRFDQHIKAIENLKKNAKEWVQDEKWKQFLNE